jgi:hypothetical protein
LNHNKQPKPPLCSNTERCGTGRDKKRYQVLEHNDYARYGEQIPRGLETGFDSSKNKSNLRFRK